jgi:ABC-type sugar transport system permease subunit
MTSSTTASSPKEPRWSVTERIRDTLTGYAFIAPAVTIIAVFGLFPIGYAIYMSFFAWKIVPQYTLCLPHLEEVYRGLPLNQRDEMPRLWQLDYELDIAAKFQPQSCFDNYTKTLGDWVGAGLFVVGVGLLVVAYVLWTSGTRDVDGEMRRTRWFENPPVKIGLSVVLWATSLGLIAYGWERMFETGNERFLKGLVYTVYYAIFSVPIQLTLGLILAYVLFQNIKGKSLFRMIFFVPYITPAVAAATVFKLIFSPRPSSLANQMVALAGLQPQAWLGEPKPFLNALFGANLSGIFAGPSLALLSIILFGIWTYVGYNVIIYLAGLGQIPNDLYEAARVDGASEWHLFRYITLPMISPITFYLSILGFIGTFKTFNHVYVMRSDEARGTADTISVVVFDTFRLMQQYGEAAAQAIILLVVIVAITQFQRTFLEKQVFYG